MEKLDRKKARNAKSTSSSPAREAWIRLKRNRLAVAGMIILALLILTAIFADVIAPYGIDEQNYADVLQGPSIRHFFSPFSLFLRFPKLSITRSLIS